MPNFIDVDGIHTQSYQEIVVEFENQYRNIYGQDINLDPNSPDGQRIHIEALAKKDVLNLITQYFSALDPNQAIGVALDYICSLSGIFRRGGSYTTVLVNITSNRQLTLTGLDSASGTPYTVKDSAGNRFFLKNTTTLSVGTSPLLFQAQRIGEVLVTPNSLIAETVVIGVTGVNNPAGAQFQGTDTETDAQFRERRRMQVGLPSSGFEESMKANITSLPFVLDAKIYENWSDNISDGTTPPNTPANIPAHSIWAIVKTSAPTNPLQNVQIAEAINSKRGSGCGMKGGANADAQTPFGTKTIYWDFAIAQPLYIRFDARGDGGLPFDPVFLESALASSFNFGIYQDAKVISVTSAIYSILDNITVSGVQVSKNGVNWSDTSVTPTAYYNFFAVDKANINITVLP